MSRSSLICILLHSLLCYAQGRADEPPPHLAFQTVALSGQPALMAGGGAAFSEFYYLSIGDGGHVAFSGIMAGPAIIDHRFAPGVWSGQPGELTNVLRGGVNGPGVDGYIYAFFAPTLNAKGELAINASLNPEVGYHRDNVIWVGVPGQLQVAAREGEHAPGTEPTTVFSDNYHDGTTLNFEGVQLNDLTQLTFQSHLGGPGIPRFQGGIWSGPPDALQLVVREGSQAHELPQGTTYSGLFAHDNPNGVIGFKSFLSGPAVSDVNNVGAWVGMPSNFRLLGREGSGAPGVPLAIFEQLNFGGPAEVDHAGRAIFPARLSGPGITSTNDLGYWSGDGDDVRLLFRNGDPVPGFNGLRFASVAVELGPTGQYTVIARLAGGGVGLANDGALMLGTPGNLRMIVREGDPAPGAAGSIVIGDIHPTSLGIPTSQFGHVAFRTALAGPGVNDTNDIAYYLSNTDGALFLVAREGDMFDIGGGSLKRIAHLDDVFGGPSDATMNASGELFFRAVFADGSSGLFIAQVVPEPMTISLICSALLVLVLVFVLGRAHSSNAARPLRKRSIKHRVA